MLETEIADLRIKAELKQNELKELTKKAEAVINNFRMMSEAFNNTFQTELKVDLTLYEP